MGNSGCYKRIHQKWSLENFNDGYVDAKGRMRIYYPDHKRASKLGYMLRSIVAYEIYHNEKVTKDFAIHHKDKNKLNDSKENLEKIEFGEHTRLHNEKPKVERICKICSKMFLIKAWRLKTRENRGSYCSQECYKKRQISQATINKSILKRAKLTKNKVLEIRSLYPIKTQLELSNLYNVSRSAINSILNNYTWRNI